MTSLLETRAAGNAEALERATRFAPNGNDVPTILAFKSRGIDDAITFGPGQNVFTYRAWQAKGRQVRKGEKSVRVTVWVSKPADLDPDTGERKPEKRFPKTACVFHVSQTDAKGGVSC